MANNSVRLRFTSLTVQGKNPAKVNNEDYSCHYQGKYGDLFLLCDGMGGEVGGEIASRMVVESIHEYFETHYIEGEENTTIAQSVEYAQYKLIEYTKLQPDMAGMGTTLVLLLIKDNKYYFANVGDSRIYLLRNGALMQLTTDHSEVQRMVEQGLITREEAAIHPLRNIITRALGSSNYKPDIAGPHHLQEGDVFLLCSDGLTEYVKDDEILQQLSEEPLIAAHNLIDLALHRGGLDDITVGSRSAYQQTGSYSRRSFCFSSQTFLSLYCSYFNNCSISGSSFLLYSILEKNPRSSNCNLCRYFKRRTKYSFNFTRKD